MIVESSDLIDWVADRDTLLIAAWAPELSQVLGWDEPFAEAFAAELHEAMLRTMLRLGTEADFLKLVSGFATGLDPKIERAVAGKFYHVTLMLARSAARRIRVAKVARALPYIRTSVVADNRARAGEVAIDGIILPHDHPFWSRWYPPLDMECRCMTIAMTYSQLARSGKAVTSETELAERERSLSLTWPKAFEPLLDFRRWRPSAEV